MLRCPVDPDEPINKLCNLHAFVYAIGLLESHYPLVFRAWEFQSQ